MSEEPYSVESIGSQDQGSRNRWNEYGSGNSDESWNGQSSPVNRQGISDPFETSSARLSPATAVDESDTDERVEAFQDDRTAFSRESRGLSDLIKSNDGAYNYREMTSGSALSTHSRGIAFDINAGDNWFGKKEMTEDQRKLAEVITRYGFYHLPGDWMHFQYCDGY
jgi:hypothetical protein